MFMTLEVIRIVVLVLSYRGLAIGTVWYMRMNVSILYSHSLINPKKLTPLFTLMQFFIFHLQFLFFLLVFH